MVVPIVLSGCSFPPAQTIPHVRASITDVRIAVARSESMFLTPSLANMAVSAAKNADRSAYSSHMVLYLYIEAMVSVGMGIYDGPSVIVTDSLGDGEPEAVARLSGVFRAETPEEVCGVKLLPA